MKIQQLIRAIKVGIRSRLLICLLVVATGYCFTLSHSPIVRLASIIGVLLTSEAMIMLWVPSFARLITLPWGKKNLISWEDCQIFKDFRAIAKEQNIRLNKKRPFGIRRNFDNAYANPLTGQIIIGDKLLKKLGDELSTSLIGHELTHIKRNHHLKMMVGTMFVPAIIAIPLRIFGTPDIVYQLVLYAGFFIMFLLISWHNEYDADYGAAKISGTRNTIIMLRKLVPRRQWRNESETHPSINSRILKLKKRA